LHKQTAQGDKKARALALSTKLLHQQAPHTQGKGNCLGPAKLFWLSQTQSFGFGPAEMLWLSQTKTFWPGCNLASAEPKPGKHF